MILIFAIFIYYSIIYQLKVPDTVTACPVLLFKYAFTSLFFCKREEASTVCPLKFPVFLTPLYTLLEY